MITPGFEIPNIFTTPKPPQTQSIQSAPEKTGLQRIDEFFKFIERGAEVVERTREIFRRPKDGFVSIAVPVPATKSGTANVTLLLLIGGLGLLALVFFMGKS